MKVVEIRNNLIKVEFESDEGLILGHFIVLASSQKSYVAQIINIKLDEMRRHAIAKLLFTFTSDGVVDNYDGSIPDIESETTLLSSQELLDLLPVETPIKFGHLAQQDSVLNLDISIFEHNFTVFSDHDFEKFTFISNCLHQLSKDEEKCVVIDDSNIFENSKKIFPGKDFKIPLNSEMLDYIYDNEFSDAGVESKVVIKGILSEIEQYINTLDEKFLSIDKFVGVITSQYQQNKIPELALLRSKLLKFKDSGLFANSADEVHVFADLLEKDNTIIIDVKNLESPLQNKMINMVHDELNSINKYIYLFVSIHDDNSDKSMIRKFINHSHVFTTIFAPHSYKYAAELKEHAQNIVFYTPQTLTHEFASYNTFLSKLNHDEFVIYGKLTQGIPFIVESEIVDSAVVDIQEQEDEIIQEELLKQNTQVSGVEEPEAQIPEAVQVEDYSEPKENSKKVIEPIDNLMAEDEDEEEVQEAEEEEETETFNEQEEPEEEYESEEPEIEDELPEDEEYFENPNISEITSELQEPLEDEVIEEESEEELSAEDLDFIDNAMPAIVEDTQGEDISSIPSEDEIYEDEVHTQDSTPIVPVYPAEDVDASQEPDDIGFVQGDMVKHPRYGRGVIEKIIKYGNKTLCSISFDNVGRRLLDPSISEFQKV
ncbi:hypothetical protein IJ596_02105 [bacterium]|nr:hypothetical protein [bacterium]